MQQKTRINWWLIIAVIIIGIPIGFVTMGVINKNSGPIDPSPVTDTVVIDNGTTIVSGKEQTDSDTISTPTKVDTSTISDTEGPEKGTPPPVSSKDTTKTIKVKDKSLSFPSDGGEASVKVKSRNLSWKVTTDKEWLTIVENETGDKDATVRLHAEPSPGTERTAIVTIHDADDITRKEVVKVTQSGIEKILKVRNNNLKFRSEEEELSFEIVCKNVNWTVSTDKEWLIVTEHATGDMNAKVKLKAELNTGALRTASVIIQDVSDDTRKVTFMVTQEKSDIEAQKQLRNEVQDIIITGKKDSRIPENCYIVVNGDIIVNYQHFRNGVKLGSYSDIDVIKVEGNSKVISKVFVKAKINSGED